MYGRRLSADERVQDYDVAALRYPNAAWPHHIGVVCHPKGQRCLLHCDRAAGQLGALRTPLGRLTDGRLALEGIYRWR